MQQYTKKKEDRSAEALQEYNAYCADAMRKHRAKQKAIRQGKLVQW